MKILWCFVFFLVFNNFQTIVSKLLNENEEKNSVQNLMQKIEVLQKLFEKSDKACLEQNQQRLEALETLFNKNLQSQNENFGRIDTALEQNEQRIEAQKKLFNKNLQSQEQNFGRINSSLEQNEQRIEAQKKLFNKNLQSQEENFGRIDTLEQNEQIQDTKIGALQTLLEESIEINNKSFGALEKLHEKKVERVDCGEKCLKDDSCTAVFWSNSSDSECRFNQDKSTLVNFVPGELYYCKDCQTTRELVFEAESSGVIKLTNVATNKTTQASSVANAMSDPSKAVDGDPNTWFSSEVLATEGGPWLMVDLGQRFLVAQIRIQVRTKANHTLYSFVVCLIDAFDKEGNPCKQHSEILKVNRSLSGYSELFDVKQVKMGRYVVIKKLEENVLEIAELEVMSVVPIQSYECNSCLAESNTVCDESRIPPNCSCTGNNLPVDGDARNGCKDPCLDFKEDNAVCARVDHETRSCSCNADYHPVNGDACNGCNDPCNGFKDRNNECVAVSFEHRSCECKEGFLEIFKEDACFGCLDPCVGFREQYSHCLAKDGIRYECSCEEGFVPIHGNDPCQGCICQGCKVCPSSLGYKSYRDFGCLKVHETSKSWEDARSICENEGGDLFSPGDKLPILPKDEMNLEGTVYWIGARRRGNGPYERINSGGKLADDSQLWRSSQPNRNGECVYYYTGSGLLLDYLCTDTDYFVCQIG